MTEIAQATPEAARRLTDRIKVGLEGTWQLIQEAYLTQSWAALGYRSWDEYCAAEFEMARLRLPREDRREVVGSLRDAGLSVRAIVAATGAARNTVRDDLRQVGHFAPPEEPPPIRGVDGKTYRSARPSPQQQHTTDSLPPPQDHHQADSGDLGEKAG